MDSTITHGYENPDDVPEVNNKQVDFPANNMEFTHNNFSSDDQIAPANFQVPGGPYEVQPTTESTYNPVESVQQISFENQGHQHLENIVNQAYYSAPETQFQRSYTPEQQPDSEIVHSNNGMKNATTEPPIESMDMQNSVSEHHDTDDTKVVEEDSTSNEQSEQISESIKIENGDIADKIIEKQNGEDEISMVEQNSAGSIKENETTSNQETIAESTEDEVKEEEVLTDIELSTNENIIIEKQLIAEVSEPINVESSENTPQFTDTQTHEQQQEHYTTVEEITVEKIPLKDQYTAVEENTSDNSFLREHCNVVEENMGENISSTPKDQYTIIEENLSENISSPTDNYTVVEENTSDNISSSIEEYTVVEEIPRDNTSCLLEDPTKSEGKQDDEVIEILKQEEEHAGPQHQQNQGAVEKKQRRTRKPVHDLPMHLIGHNISKPVDPVPNGRALPKPRIGVKVPYRNLTSQIVSKAELEEEILERARAKELAVQKGDLKFARSLTQRLANKIAPERERRSRRVTREATAEQQIEQIEIKGTRETEIRPSPGSSNSLAAVNDSKIQNDDDLLAILEGEGEEMPILPSITMTQVDDSNLKLLEREIALQQLQELPHQEAKERILKPRFARGPLSKCDTPPKKLENVHSSNNVTSAIPKTSPQKNSQPLPKSNTPSIKKSGIDLEIQSPMKKPVEVEPQVRVNMVLKTYSRKRKPSDVPEFEVSSPKRPLFEDSDTKETIMDPLALPTDVYITKSSRIIKKKVIWDPDDEQTGRSTKSSVSKVIESTKITPTKAVKPTPIPEKKPAEKHQVDKSKPEQKLIEKETSRKVISKKSPVSKPKRGLSEVDKLLMDEGAVKMLYDLKGEESAPGKKKKDVYSVEKAEKEIIKKANLLKNDLVQNTSNESPKSLRKKEGPSSSISPPTKPNPIMERKMSKDSTRSSVVTPPRSPAFQFSSQSSMLIRRRSSSSISSEDMEEDLEPRVTKSSKKTETPKVKKQRKNTSNEDDTKDTKEEEKTSTKETPKPVKGAQYKSFTLKKLGKHVCLDLNYIDDNCYFTITVLEELIAALKKLEKDKEINVVSLTSTSQSFCLGLDYRSLVASETSERIDKATELAKTVREFLLCLLYFPKILVAGIQGDCVGLGVTMLTLFDTVIASDTATFSTPYANYGCLGEATFLLTYPNLSNNGLAAELLYANQKLTADEAFRRGLISKLCWPEKYNDTLKTFLNSVAKGSSQSLETTKRQLRTKLYEEVEAAIDTEMEIMIEHWTSSECQENFSKIEK